MIQLRFTAHSSFKLGTSNIKLMFTKYKLSPLYPLLEGKKPFGRKKRKPLDMEKGVYVCV